MSLEAVNTVIENFTKLFYETESLALKQGIKCLTTTELHVIEAIGNQSLSMNNLSDKLGITMGTATVAINKLSNKGFITRKRSDNDRRKVFVSLSKKGEDALTYHNNFHKMIISSITKNIETENLEIFTDVFTKIYENLKNQIEFFKPDVITNFLEGDSVSVLDIKGTPVIKNFFAGMGIKLYTELKITSNSQRVIAIRTPNGEVVEINTIDAKNLVVVKKDI
ncbi:MarR family winged helix-turn-helix transcriptional regulator [Psychrilyobacter sp.]|uniref:MarR family winged helix-turn-helix transcriptional regulator n=1 Tax=Psychrilyobacter sp. TaxID=2586924 RepID=UPI00301A114D